MSREKKLSRRQLAVLTELFTGDPDEQAVLAKYNVSRTIYNKWLADEAFAEAFDRRIAAAYRQSELIIARYAPLAAAKLVALTESTSQETARKACLDIISMPVSAARKTLQKSEAEAPPPSPPLPDQTASRLLAALAEQAHQMPTDDNDSNN